jgi:hypothetical protein
MGPSGWRRHTQRENIFFTSFHALFTRLPSDIFKVLDFVDRNRYDIKSVIVVQLLLPEIGASSSVQVPSFLPVYSLAGMTPDTAVSFFDFYKHQLVIISVKGNDIDFRSADSNVSVDELITQFFKEKNGLIFSLLSGAEVRQLQLSWC